MDISPGQPYLRAVPDPRPDLRHARRTDVVTYRIRVDLDGADPPIWRLIDVRSDLTLDVLHQVLQVAFEWTDSHLHRFSLGSTPWDPRSQAFLCPYDEDDGLPAADVRVDETLSRPGDVLHYLYDYGDTWEHTLRLEQMLPRTPATAVVVDGERTAPPKDCGVSATRPAWRKCSMTSPGSNRRR